MTTERTLRDIARAAAQDALKASHDTHGAETLPRPNIHAQILSQLLDETSLLYSQECCAVDKERCDALEAGIAALGIISRPVWDCRICGFGVCDGAALDWIRDHGEHYNAVSEWVPNKGTAYCPTCSDETLRCPASSGPQVDAQEKPDAKAPKT